MPDNYSWDIGDALSNIKKVNAISPNPNYDATGISNASGGMESLYGIDPAKLDQKFGQSYKEAVGGYDPFPGDHSKIDQLQELYGTVGGAYDVTDTLKALGATRSSNLLGGEQAANNAAQKYAQTAIPGSRGGEAGASVLRAQALLPFLNADTEAAGEMGKYGDTAKQKALDAASGIATTLATLQQQYTQSLANYNSDKANFGLNYADKRTGRELQASGQQTANRIDMAKINAQLAENARQANLQAALQSRGQDINAHESSVASQLAAAQALMKAPGPTGTWTTDSLGHVDSGQSAYDAYQQYLAQQEQAKGTLARLS